MVIVPFAKVVANDCSDRPAGPRSTPPLVLNCEP
jgi:hypothetical protein